MSRTGTVYIVHTGGHIGMRKDSVGHRSVPGYLAEQLPGLMALHADDMPRYEVREYNPPLDSASVMPEDWSKIGADLMARYDDFDGFVILHEPETMAYSASALSFMLKNLTKPVVFTGSQLPLAEAYTDAREILISSLLIAAREGIPEVCILAGHRLLRANRSTRVRADRFDGFESPNYPVLGKGRNLLKIHRERLLATPNGDLSYHENRAAHIASVRIFPGIRAKTLEQLLQPPLQAAVLHTYGTGSFPEQPNILAVLRKAADRGVVLINCSQCLEGTVEMAADRHYLGKAGVVSGFDMTPEAALTKLYYLLSLEIGVAEVRRRMQQSIRGELTNDLSQKSI